MRPSIRAAAALVVICVVAAFIGFPTSSTGATASSTDLQTRAAAPLALGKGTLPGVGVAGDGTAFLAWLGPTGTLEFCRLPRAATQCDVRQAIAAPGASIRRPFVVVAGQRVVVIQHRYGGDVPDFRALYRFTSSDGGATFGPGEVVGRVPFNEAVVGPGDTMTGVADADQMGGVLQNVTGSGPNATEDYAQLWGGDHPYGGAVALLPDGAPLALYQALDGTAQFRRHVAGPINDEASWSAPLELGRLNNPKLVGGPSGVFLFGTTDSFPYSTYVRPWTGTTFGARTVVARATEVPLAAHQDAGGRLHVVLAHGRGPIDLVHAVSDDGRSWVSGIIARQGDGGVADTRVATAADHVGVAVWTGGPAPGQIRLSRIGPGAPIPRPGIALSGAARAGARTVRVAVEGRIRLPAFVSASQGCRGRAALEVFRGDRRIARKAVDVSRGCEFVATWRLDRDQVGGAQRLTVKASFAGTAALLPASRTVRIRVR